jgi:hypothetical protein
MPTPARRTLLEENCAAIRQAIHFQSIELGMRVAWLPRPAPRILPDNLSQPPRTIFWHRYIAEGRRSVLPLRNHPLVVALFAVAACNPILSADDKPLRQVIDAKIQAAWQESKINPADRAVDAAFLRRIYLDLVGTIPTAEEAAKFLKDDDAGKREKLIDTLLADPRFATAQANVWDVILFGRNPAGGDATRKRDGFKKWLAGKFANNDPYDHWVRDLLLAEQEGTELYYVQFRAAPEDAAVAVSRIFLGTQLQCARCHDHPYKSWKQREFYGMAGFFVRLVVLDNGDQKKFAIGEKSTGEVLFTGAVKDQKPGQKGEPVKPKFLAGSELDEPAVPKDFKEPPPSNKSMPRPVFSRKEKLADWVVAADNPFFARAVANRVWAQFMGRGLVHPVDDLDEKTESLPAGLLETATKELVAHKFDLKWYIRELVNTETYQLAAEGALTDALPEHFERARVRPLSVEELIASLRQATGYDAGGGKPGPLPGAGDEYFLRYFGEPTNGLGDFQGSLAEHLFLNNSDVVKGLIQRRKGNLADTILTSTDPWEDRINRMFLAVLNRFPRPEEQKRFLAHVKSDPKPDALVEEAIWVLLNTSEFRFNH